MNKDASCEIILETFEPMMGQLIVNYSDLESEISVEEVVRNVLPPSIGSWFNQALNLSKLDLGKYGSGIETKIFDIISNLRKQFLLHS